MSTLSKPEWNRLFEQLQRLVLPGTQFARTTNGSWRAFDSCDAPKFNPTNGLWYVDRSNGVMLLPGIGFPDLPPADSLFSLPYGIASSPSLATGLPANHANHANQRIDHE